MLRVPCARPTSLSRVGVAVGCRCRYGTVHGKRKKVAACGVRFEVRSVAGGGFGGLGQNALKSHFFKCALTGDPTSSSTSRVAAFPMSHSHHARLFDSGVAFASIVPMACPLRHCRTRSHPPPPTQHTALSPSISPSSPPRSTLGQLPGAASKLHLQVQGPGSVSSPAPASGGPERARRETGGPQAALPREEARSRASRVPGEMGSRPSEGSRGLGERAPPPPPPPKEPPPPPKERPPPPPKEPPPPPPNESR